MLKRVMEPAPKPQCGKSHFSPLKALGQQWKQNPIIAYTRRIQKLGLDCHGEALPDHAQVGCMWWHVVWLDMKQYEVSGPRAQSEKTELQGEKPAPHPKQMGYSCGKQLRAVYSPQDQSLMIHVHMWRDSGLSRSTAALPRDLSFAFSFGSRAEDASLGLLSSTMHCAAYKCCKSLGCFGWVRVFSPTIFLKPASWPLEAIKHSITSQINCNSAFKC